MRRKNDKDIIKENIVFLILGCAGILTGFFVLFLPFLTSTPYEEYREKEIVVSGIERDHYIWGNSFTSIVADDGIEYNISGKYNFFELESLSVGTEASIKYGKNKVFPFIAYIEEMTVDGKQMVTYDNDEPVNWTLTIIFSLILIILGIGFLCFLCFFLVRNRELQAKRDARIAKKYGV